MISRFKRFWRQSSKVTRNAFWVVIVAAVISLAILPLSYATNFSNAGLSMLSNLCAAAMLGGLVVEGISLRRDVRRLRRMTVLPASSVRVVGRTKLPVKH